MPYPRVGSRAVAGHRVGTQVVHEGVGIRGREQASPRNVHAIGDRHPMDRRTVGWSSPGPPGFPDGWRACTRAPKSLSMIGALISCATRSCGVHPVNYGRSNSLRRSYAGVWRLQFRCRRRSELLAAVRHQEPIREEQAALRESSRSGTDRLPRQHAPEQQTFFQTGRGPYQLDHVFADRGATVRSWAVNDDAAVARRLSDHAPLVIELEWHDN